MKKTGWIFASGHVRLNLVSRGEKQECRKPMYAKKDKKV
jgi:hypothetical protein